MKLEGVIIVDGKTASLEAGGLLIDCGGWKTEKGRRAVLRRLQKVAMAFGIALGGTPVAK